MENKQVTDDLRFMRSMIEKTHREIDPEVPSMISWGLFCLVIYLGIQILVTLQLYSWIYPLVYTLSAVALPLNLWFGYKVSKREKRTGLVSHIRKQINWIWGILVINGVFWTWLVAYKHLNPCLTGYLWAWIYATALSATGILHSKEWLFGGIAVFIAMPIGVFIHPYEYYLFGPVLCLACIIPSIIALRRLRRLEKADEQVQPG